MGWTTSRSSLFTPGKRPRYAVYTRLVELQGRFERVKTISPPPLKEIRSPDRPACSESLYRLSYPGPVVVGILFFGGGGATVWFLNNHDFKFPCAHWEVIGVLQRKMSSSETEEKTLSGLFRLYGHFFCPSFPWSTNVSSTSHILFILSHRNECICVMNKCLSTFHLQSKII